MYHPLPVPPPRYSLIKPPHDPTQRLGLVLVAPEAGPDGPGRRAAVGDGPEGGVVAEADSGGGASCEEVVLQVGWWPGCWSWCVSAGGGGGGRGNSTCLTNRSTGRAALAGLRK